MPTQLEKCEALRELHRADRAWIIPNPWDVGSARLLEGSGFRALATTSSGLAYTLGRADGEVSLEEKLQHCTALCAATAIPVSADFENGYSEETAGMVSNIRRLAQTGIAGLSIEDYSREHHRLYAFSESVERVRLAAQTIAELGMPLQLTARAENLLRGVDDVGDTISRLQAFSAAGADVLYAPGVKTHAQLRQITSALDKPFNVLASFMPDSTVEEFSRSGATRISLGGALNLASINPVLRAGSEMLERGTFGWLGGRADGARVNALLSRGE